MGVDAALGPGTLESAGVGVAVSPRVVPACRPALDATPVQILPWVVRRGSVEAPCEEARAPLGVETHRQWSDRASRPTPVLPALCSLGTVLTLTLSQGEQVPVSVTAWSHTRATTFADGLAWVRRHPWRARSLVYSAPEPEVAPWSWETFDVLLHGFPLAA